LPTCAFPYRLFGAAGHWSSAPIPFSGSSYSPPIGDRHRPARQEIERTGQCHRPFDDPSPWVGIPFHLTLCGIRGKGLQHPFRHHPRISRTDVLITGLFSLSTSSSSSHIPALLFSSLIQRWRGQRRAYAAFGVVFLVLVAFTVSVSVQVSASCSSSRFWSARRRPLRGLFISRWGNPALHSLGVRLHLGWDFLAIHCPAGQFLHRDPVIRGVCASPTFNSRINPMIPLLQHEFAQNALSRYLIAVLSAIVGYFVCCARRPLPRIPSLA